MTAAVVAGCGSGGGGDGSSSQLGSDPSVDAGDSGPVETPVQSNTILHNDSPGLALQGEFERVDGYLSESPSVLRSAAGMPAKATFSLPISQRGFYELYVWWPQGGAEGGTVDITIRHATGKLTLPPFDQSALGGQWKRVGTFQFDRKIPASLELSTDGRVPLLVDAVRMEFLGEAAPSIEIVTSELAIAELRSRYSEELEVRGGVTQLNFSIVEGALPPGLSLDYRSGRISGVPSRAGSYPFGVSVGDANGSVVSRSLEIEVISVPVPDPGTDPDTDPGTDPDTDPSTDPDTDPGTDPDTDPGPDTGTDPDTEPDTEPDTRSLQSIISSMPSGSWARVNLNRFSDVWAPAALRPLYGSGNPTPSRIIRAWSSFAWDSSRQSLFLYGGGHANYRGNDTYIWRGATRSWERASLPSEIKQDDLGNWNAIDGADAAPASAHTYDNTIYLPIIDRVLTLGGAADHNGAHYKRQATDTTSRNTGPYLFDMSRADPNKVGGTTGSHVQRVAPYPEIVGGNMWSNRENYLNASPPPTHSFANGCTGYAEENGKDVVYVRTSAALHRYTIHSLSDPTRDTWEKVGTHWNAPGSQVTCAYDPVGKSLVRTGTNAVPFVFWNLNTAGPNNRDVQVPTPEDPTGEFAALRERPGFMISRCAMDFDPLRRQYTLWCGDGVVWTLQPPQTLSASGWVIRKQDSGGNEVPNGEVGTGILGKWEYARDLDVFVGLQHETEGNVWIYKPGY